MTKHGKRGSSLPLQSRYHPDREKNLAFWRKLRCQMLPIFRENLGGSLQLLRKERGWCLDTAAYYGGVNPDQLSRYERGLALPGTYNLILLAKLYKVSVEDLVQYDDVFAEILEVTQCSPNH